MATLVALDGLVLAATYPAAAAAPGQLPHLAARIDALGPDRVAADLAAAALWLIAARVAIGVLAGLAAGAPGAAGRAADRLAQLVLPRVVYRLMAGTAGLGVLTAAPLAAAAPAAAAPAVVAAAPAMVAAAPIAGVPAAAAAPSAGVAAAAAAPIVPAAAAVAPGWPSDAPLPAPGWPTTDAPASPPVPATSARKPPARSGQPTRPAAGSVSAVVVRPGDSLWRIAADHLPPHSSPARIARAWPRWFAANRATIGSDPDLLTPGQTLRAPEATS